MRWLRRPLPLVLLCGVLIGGVAAYHWATQPIGAGVHLCTPAHYDATAVVCRVAASRLSATDLTTARLSVIAPSMHFAYGTLTVVLLSPTGAHLFTTTDTVGTQYNDVAIGLQGFPVSFDDTVVALVQGAPYTFAVQYGNETTGNLGSLGSASFTFTG